MYKVLLVDDEMFVRKGLMNLIDWHSLGYEICGEASNGEEALDSIEQLQPDLVIADIRMPVLDGLALIHQVTSQMENPPLFVIVSGYHDFKYAQQALRYGVHDYILKPIDEMELESTIRKLASALDLKKLASLTGEKLVTESIVETLLHGHYSDEDERALAAALQMEETGKFVYLLAEIQDGYSGMGEQQQWTVKDISAALQDVMDQMNCHIPVYEQKKSLFGLLLNLNRLAPEGDKENLYQSLHNALSEKIKMPLMLYAGDPVERLRNARESSRSANEALSYKYAEDGATIICAQQVHGTSLYFFDIDAELYTRLIEKLEENDSDSYRIIVDRLFDEFKTKRFAPTAVANAITRCAIGVINVIREMEGDEKELQLLPGMMEWNNRHSRLQDLKVSFITFIEEASVYIAKLRGEQAKGGIERIRKYIEANYSANISLKSISGKFYMNSVYLGQLFRKTYGVYFNDFLLNIRIGEAKKLLRQTDLRMYEIAEKVGFQNADYFATQFEKLEKVTPTDYRNKLLGKK
ncbi:MAG: response regulator [Candidatus Pristimantibacillus sp.]